MNNFNFPLKNNSGYDDIELNNKINEYNQIYNDYKDENIWNNGNNFNKNQNNIINNNENISIKEQKNKNRKEKKLNSNNTNFKNKKINISNNHFSYDNPSLDFENLSQIENDYDAYISNLKMKLLKNI